MDPQFERCLEAETRVEAVGASAHAREADRSGGVGWSGLGPGPFRSRSSDALRADAGARHARLQVWRASAPGRLTAALARAQEAARLAHAAAETLRAACARAGDRSPPCDRELDRLEAGALEMLRQAAIARAALGG
ncbi:MAG: hypothetical protein ABI655_04410 [Phenylobacterium sp.]